LVKQKFDEAKLSIGLLFLLDNEKIERGFVSLTLEFANVVVIICFGFSVTKEPDKLDTCESDGEVVFGVVPVLGHFRNSTSSIL